MKLTMMLLLILMALTILFTQLAHTLWMDLTLIINTTVTPLMIATLSKSPRFSYVLFLVFLRGMLVPFIYVTSLASNEMFYLNSKMLMFFSNHCYYNDYNLSNSPLTNYHSPFPTSIISNNYWTAKKFLNKVL